jgi:hypothetical protein
MSGEERRVWEDGHEQTKKGDEKTKKSVGRRAC